MSDAPQTFEAWVLEWKDEILQAQEFSKSDLPADPALIKTDLDTTTREFPRMSELLADAEGHVVRCRAFETLNVKADPKYEDLTAQERRSVVEGRLIDTVRVRDILKAVCRALDQRHYALLNQRRYEEAAIRMAGRGA